MELVRFHHCACRLRTNVPGPFSPVGAHSVRPRAGLGPALHPRRGGCPHPPAKLRERWLAEGQTDEGAFPIKLSPFKGEGAPEGGG